LRSSRSFTRLRVPAAGALAKATRALSKARAARLSIPPETASVRPATGRSPHAGDLERRTSRSPGRSSEDDDQRVELGRRRVHVGLRDSLSPPGAPSSRARQPQGRVPSQAHLVTSPEAESYKLNQKIADAAGPAARLAPAREASPSRASGSPARSPISGSSYSHNARETLEPGPPVPTSICRRSSRIPRGEAVETMCSCCRAQEKLGIPRGSVRATVRSRPCPPRSRMDEILYELRDHSGGLNAGRWDYIFSLTRSCGAPRPDPARSAADTMTVRSCARTPSSW